MKLISLYIDHFGTLCSFTLDFEGELTVINQPNGFGKTTLAEFIRAMFYGFPRKMRTLDKSKRQKYAPWGGGLYGGNLVFEHEGVHYRIERTFGTVPKEDTFILIDLASNRRSSRFSEDIGIELFGLDSDSFVRSVYLPQAEADGPLATAAIQAKLTNLVEDSGDVSNFDKAIATLRAKRAVLIPFRGSGGAVAEAVAMVSRLQTELDQAVRSQADLAQEQEMLDKTEFQLQQKNAALAQIGAELAAVSELSVAAALQEQYGQLWEQYSQTDRKLRQLERSNPVTQREIDICKERCAELDGLQGRILHLQSGAAEQMRAERLRRNENTQSLRSVVPVLMLLGWVIGAAGLASGAVLLILRQVLFGHIGLGIGAISLLVTVLLLLSRRRKRHQLEAKLQAEQGELDQRLKAIQQECDSLRNQCAQLCQEIQRFLEPHFGAVEPRDFRACLAKLEQDVREMELARIQKKAFSKRLAEFRAEHEKALEMETLSLGDARQLRNEEQSLRDALTELTGAKLRIGQNIQMLRMQAARAPQLRDELYHWQQRLETDRKNADILDDTMAFLQQAREKLATSYLDTIRAAFGEYLIRLEGCTGENYLIDSDFQVQPERMGQARELAYFSVGQTDLLLFCMRLALVDTLFKEQETFVILDDPFVNLDDAHLVQGLKLLRSLSHKHQILYLTCHSSRMP